MSEQLGPAPERPLVEDDRPLVTRILQALPERPPTLSAGWARYRNECGDFVDRLRAALAEPAKAHPVVTVTDAMVTAYLKANAEYWARVDAEPSVIGKWRNGTPTEATRYALIAALAEPPRPTPLSFDQLQSVMSRHFGGRELTDDEADSAEAFARAVESAVRRQFGVE